MDLTEIESHLEGVEEEYEEVECKLAEVREGAKEVERILNEVRDTLVETRWVIELVKEELKREVYDDCNDKEEVNRVIKQLLEAEWRHEELENSHDALSRTPDSDEAGGH